jgi:hypothetical protein
VGGERLEQYLVAERPHLLGRRQRDAVERQDARAVGRDGVDREVVADDEHGVRRQPRGERDQAVDEGLALERGRGHERREPRPGSRAAPAGVDDVEGERRVGEAADDAEAVEGAADDHDRHRGAHGRASRGT